MKGAEGDGETGLGQGGALDRAARGIDAAGQNHQGSEGEHDKRIDKDPQHGHITLLGWMVRPGQRVSVGGGTHACFIGEEPSGYAQAEGFFDRNAGQPPGQGLRAKSAQ